MNWEAIGAVGEVVGAIAVVATIAYLAGQVRASNQAAQISSRISTERMYFDFLAQLVSSPELDELMKRGREDFDSLSASEKHRFSNVTLQFLQSISSTLAQHQMGVLSDDAWYEYLKIVRFWMSGSGMQQWWQVAGKTFFSPSFRAFIDAEIDRLNARSEATGVLSEEWRL
jgi:hypothetical protein